MRTTAAVLFSLAIGPVLLAAPPRITFERVTPAPHDLGVEEVAVVSAIGDSPSIDLFLEILIAQANKSRVLRMRDGRGSNEQAEAFLQVKSYSCETFVREGEGSARDVDNNRVRRKHYWADAVCTVRIDVLSKSLQRRSSFSAKGEGTSPRVAAVGDDERKIAVDQAARYAAIDAAERITPRRVRESIPLDPAAPAFEEGLSMIDAGRLEEAREIWRTALRATPRSAPLQFNLGAVCEALGDRAAAEQHYVAARDFAPGEARYALELKLFVKRGK